MLRLVSYKLAGLSSACSSKELECHCVFYHRAMILECLVSRPCLSLAVISTAKV